MPHTPRKVYLQATETEGHKKTDTLVGSLLYIGQDYTAIAIDKLLLVKPLKQLSATCDHKAVKNSKLPGSLSTSIISLMSQGYFSAISTPEKIANHLGVSLRSLQRYLATEKVNLKQIIDTERFRKAKIMLAEKENSLVEIAEQLGYSESSHFSRAFKYWSGVSPGRFRSHGDYQH